MHADSTLQVMPEATAAANAVTSSVAAHSMVSASAQPAHAAAADASHAISLWAPIVADYTTVRQQVSAGEAALALRSGAVAHRNDQALTDITRTEYQNTSDLTAHPAMTT